jgi:hypothetical protein
MDMNNPPLINKGGFFLMVIDVLLSDTDENVLRKAKVCSLELEGMQ